MYISIHTYSVYVWCMNMYVYICICIRIRWHAFHDIFHRARDADIRSMVPLPLPEVRVKGNRKRMKNEA